VANCSSYLKKQVDLVNPSIVVTLGACALKAVSQIEEHNLLLSSAVRTANRWYGRLLIPLYHPGQRAMIHRSYANQRSDYQFVAEQLKRLGKTSKLSNSNVKTDVLTVAKFIINSKTELSYFALHKLFYLVEFAYAKQHGKRLTKAFFVRQKDGPYCVDLHAEKLRKGIPLIGMQKKKDQIVLRKSQKDFFFSEKEETQLTKEIQDEILLILSKYDDLRDAELKTKVYLTTPMRQILRQEKYGKNLYNSPINLNGL
jgi:hypothetical protein